jgi:hypothetical protein
MGNKARFGLLAGAAVLAASILPAHATSAGLYLIDRQGASGILRGQGSSYAAVDAWGENFRGAFVPSLTFPLSSQSQGCVSFHGAQIQEACGHLSVVVDQALSTAQVTGVLQGNGFTLTVNLTLTARAEPPEPYAHSAIDDEYVCDPPNVTCPYATAGAARAATTAGWVTSSTLGSVGIPDAGEIYIELFWEQDVEK